LQNEPQQAKRRLEDSCTCRYGADTAYLAVLWRLGAGQLDLDVARGRVERQSLRIQGANAYQTLPPCQQRRRTTTQRAQHTLARSTRRRDTHHCNRCQSRSAKCVNGAAIRHAESTGLISHSKQSHRRISRCLPSYNNQRLRPWHLPSAQTGREHRRLSAQPVHGLQAHPTTEPSCTTGRAKAAVL
jgi:hypothetical protein